MKPMPPDWFYARAKELKAQKINLKKKMHGIPIQKLKDPIIQREYITHHHNAELILECIKNNKPFNIIGGYAPTQNLHIGSLATLRVIEYFRKNFGAKAFISIADLDGILAKNTTIEETHQRINELKKTMKLNGLNEKKTTFLIESENTFNCLRNSFWIMQFAEDSDFEKNYAGETPKTFKQKNGLMNALGDMYTPYFLNKNPTLVVVGIDEARHIALGLKIYEKIKKKYPKTPPLSAMYTKIVKGLDNNKMAKTNSEGAIYLNESPNKSILKILNSSWETFGNPKQCTGFQCAELFTLSNNREVEQIRKKCKLKELNCNQCKSYLSDKMYDFLKSQQPRHTIRNKED